MAYAAAAVMLVGMVGAVGYKAFRWRQSAALWHGRWEALHSNPAGMNHFRAANQRVARPSPMVAGRVVFLGASITEALDLEHSFRGADFVNRGTGGQLVWQQYLRLIPDAIDLNPESIVLKMCAINLLPDAPPLPETQFYFEQMVTAITQRGMKPILATTVPVTRRWDQDEAGGTATAKLRSFNDWLRAYARDHHFMVLDYAAALSDEQGYLIEALSEDGLHPNSEGRRRMIEVIRTVVVQGRVPR